MPFNILQDPFFPIVTRGSRRKWATFRELADTGDNDPVEFDWPRADFNIAALEFAIGVGTLAFRPATPSDWLRLWRDPPGPEATGAALAPFAHAFALDGDGPRFLQELGGLDGKTNPIEALLIDTPGANGQKKNADVLTHRDRYPALGLPATAMALYALQQFAPAGGAGNRTSMRGGGPLSTFVIPGAAASERPSLWRIVLANLPQGEGYEFDAQDLPKILPWLAPTLVSDKAHGERLVHEGDREAHPLQAFFGMPRRVALRFAVNGVCAMTREPGPLVQGFVQKPRGVNYGLWTHPATPYRRQKEGAEPYSVKPKSARFGYRDWTPVVIGETEGTLAQPAAILRLARHNRPSSLRGPDDADATVRAAGWAMNNMEAVAYLSAEQPLHLTADQNVRDALDLAARRFTQAAESAVAMLLQALRAALFSEGAKPATDKAVFEEARAAFYDATEDSFHDRLNAVLEAPESDGEALARGWLGALQKAAFEAFEASAPIPLDDPGRARRVAEAFRHLRAGLSGYGKSGQWLFQILEFRRLRRAPPRKESAMANDSRPDIGAILRWRSRELHPGPDTGPARAARARLRRATSVFDALLIEETVKLIRSVRGERTKAPSTDFEQRLVVLAMTLPRIASDKGPTLARALGQTTAGRAPTGDERPLLSPTRFGVLLSAARAGRWNDLARALRRATAILGDAAIDSAGLISDVLFLNDAVLRRWTYDYWQTRDPETSSETAETVLEPQP